MSTSLAQGWHDSAFDSIMRLEERRLEDNSEYAKKITPEEANQQYGIPGQLTFDAPINNTVARLMRDRKQAEIDRMFVLSEGSSAKRFLPGMAAGMLGATANPLDLGLSFMPIFGSQKVAASLAKTGAGAFRQSLARGLMSEEALVQTGMVAPRLTSSVMNGTAFMVVDQIPHLVAAHLDQEEFTGKEAAINAVMAAGFGAVIHGATRAWSKMSQATKEVMAKQAMENFLRDESSDVAKFAKVDKSHIIESMKFDAEKARAEATAAITLKDIQKAVFEKYKERPISTAYKLSDGTIISGSPLHDKLVVPPDVTVNLANEALPNRPSRATLRAEADAAGTRYILEEGFTTDKGRFVSRDEASALMGVEAPYNHLTMENDAALYGETPGQTADPEYLGSNPEEQFYRDLIELGDTHEQALDKVRVRRETIRNKYLETIPEVQDEIKARHEQAVQAFIDAEKVKHEQKVAATIKELDDTGMLKPEEVRKNIPPENFEEADTAAIQEDIKALEASEKVALKEEQKTSIIDDLVAKIEAEPIKPAVKSIEVALECIIRKIA
jgi:hypothetical protein